MLIRRAHSEKGTTVVEYALVFPFFLLLILGIMDLGWYFFVEHTLQYATREGMRLALVGRKLQDDKGNPMTREDSIIKTIKDHASLAIDPSSLSIYIFPIGDDYKDPTGWNDPKKGPDPGNPGQYMRVKTQYTYKFLTPLIGVLFSGGTILIEAQGTYRNELFDT